MSLGKHHAQVQVTFVRRRRACSSSSSWSRRWPRPRWRPALSWAGGRRSTPCRRRDRRRRRGSACSRRLAGRRALRQRRGAGRARARAARRPARRSSQRSGRRSPPRTPNAASGTRATRRRGRAPPARRATARARAIGITGSLRAVGQEDRHVAVGGAGVRPRACRRAAGSPTGRPARRAARRGAARSSASSRSPGRSRRARCARPAMPRALLARDQRLDQSPAMRAGRLRLRARAQVGAEDVVPGAHHVAAVDRHRPRRRVRKDEAHRPDRARSSSCATGTKSLPSAPRPCRMIIDARGAGPVSMFDRFEVHVAVIGCAGSRVSPIRAAIAAPCRAQRRKPPAVTSCARPRLGLDLLHAHTIGADAFGPGLEALVGGRADAVQVERDETEHAAMSCDDRATAPTHWPRTSCSSRSRPACCASASSRPRRGGCRRTSSTPACSTTAPSSVRLGEFYARRLLASGLEFDMLFGPAYKGITLAAAVGGRAGAARPQRALRLQPQGSEGSRRRRHSWSARRCAGRVVIVDDVITDGASKRESVEMIRRGRRRAGRGADRAGPDGARRQRRRPVRAVAVEDFERDYGLPVHADCDRWPTCCSILTLACRPGACARTPRASRATASAMESECDPTHRVARTA